MEWTQSNQRMWIVGHRGVRALEPENTMRSFQRAIEMGVDGIETDVQVTKDGALVLMHDHTVDRTTNGTGRVDALSLAELRALDAGKGERVPLLSEFLDLVRGSDLMLNVEMKDYTQEALERTVGMLRDYQLDEQSVIACFDSRVTTWAHALYGMKTQGFLKHALAVYEEGCEQHYYAIGVGMKDVSGECAKELVRQGIDPWCWCPDTEEEVLKCREAGFTLLTANDVRPALKILKGIEY